MELLSWKSGLAVAIFAFIYNAAIHDLLFVVIGLGRHVQHISEFPYSCRRIEDPRLAACEDMFLSAATRQLFLACSHPLARKEWMPNIARFDVSGRSLNDAVIAMDIDLPARVNGQDGFQYRVLKTPGYPSNSYDDPTLHLVGFTGIDGPDAIELLFVNAKPSRDNVTGELLDQASVGGNSTIEHFITGPAATQMKHIATYAHTHIATPNNVAAIPGRKGFFFTNDHGDIKTGWEHTISPIIASGDVTYCDTTNPANLECYRLAASLAFPNGLLYVAAHDLLYVPSAAIGNVHVYQPRFHEGITVPTLKHIHTIKIPYPIDNLSLDPYTDDILVAAFPKVSDTLAGFDDPYNNSAATVQHRVRLLSRLEGKVKYEVVKILENIAEADTPLPLATTIIQDGKTGRLFLSGVFSPYISVCDPK